MQFGYNICKKIQNNRGLSEKVLKNITTHDIISMNTLFGQVI